MKDRTGKRARPTVLERLGDLYDKAPIMLHSIDGTGRLLSVNVCFRETLGYAEEELLGRPIVDFMTEASRQDTLAYLPDFFRSGRVENRPVSMVTKDGRLIDVQISSVGEYDAQGRFVRSLSATKDMTAERQVVEQTRLHAETLEALLRLVRMRQESLADIGHFVLSRAVALTGSEDGFVLIRNRKDVQFKLIAYDPASLAVCGMLDPESAFSVETAGSWAEAYRHACPFVVNDYAAPHSGKKGLPPGHRPLTRFLVVPVLDDKDVHLLVAVANKTSPYDDADIRRVSLLGEGVLGHIKDSRREKALERARAQAESASAAKSGFLANMSHEIRTPLSGIIGLTQMSLTQSPHPEIRENLELILESSRSLLGIVNDILDFSKIEAGKMEFVPVDFDLRDTLDRTIKPFLFSFRQKGLKLSVRIDSNIPEALYGDPDRIMQVVRNLVSNAFKFTDHGGVSVELRLARHGDPMLLECCVRDTGIGIPEDRQGELFQIFSQLESARCKRHGGTGLGLAISRRLVEMMGGTIGVSSRPGEGSLFTFTVSLRPAKEDGNACCRSLDSPRTDGSFDGLRVLLAEDNQVNRVFLRHFLEDAGCKVSCAGSGAEALEALSVAPIDLVLMDIQMPEMDGVEATSRIRRGEAGAKAQKLPVVALTAYSMKGDRERFLQAGLDDYVSKPVDVEALFAVMRRVLGRRGGPTPAPAAPSPSSPACPLDMAYYDERGKSAFAREVCRMFLDESLSVKDRLERAVRDADWKAAGDVAHALLGMAVPLRAGELTEGAKRLQEAGLAGDADGCRTAVQTVMAALARVRAAIEDYLRA